MIVQQQISTARPESAQAYLGLLETEGVALLSRFPGRLTGLFACHIGPLSQIIEMWAYDTMADLDARAELLAQDPLYSAFLEKAMPLLERRETRLLSPAPFFHPSAAGVAAG